MLPAAAAHGSDALDVRGVALSLAELKLEDVFALVAAAVGACLRLLLPPRDPAVCPTGFLVELPGVVYYFLVCRFSGEILAFEDGEGAMVYGYHFPS